MSGRIRDLELTPFDDLFSAEESRVEAQAEHVVHLPLSEVEDFPNHPFIVRQDEDMQRMVDSVRQFGILLPGLVRPLGNGRYQMVAGHRRKMAATLAGLSEMPFIVRDLSDDEAIIVMVDTNIQRERVLPSERAFAYAMRLDAIRKKSGARTDLTSANDLQRLIKGQTSRDLIAEKSGKSHETVRLYIRLTHLIPELLKLVDNAVLGEKGALQMALRPGVELSYLSKEEQSSLLELIRLEECTPSLAQAKKMRTFSEAGKLSEDVMLSIIQEVKPNQREQVKIPRERLNKYFSPGTPVQQIEETIVKALELYRKRKREQAR